jgi:hypothetical protein|tara:strand:- start:1444 stop:1776 length:333 start_codon:yes stop_codon:yes gene_type:complete
MAYASGKFARALCDRCAFEYKLSQLREEWNGLKTCRDCFDPKHPQLEPLPHVSDPEALYKPRPNTDKELGQGAVYTNSGDNNSAMTDDPVGSIILGYKMTGSIGEVTITV